ncbi:hypothetical protein V3W47_00390 [Deinococcus sp. YIM 134068]|uniref:hypothetical protein n=1 Tax=Deinococcus lichenicola TaxID=3118910 RepID=UPI002F9229DF
METDISVEYLFVSSLSDSLCVNVSGFKNLLKSIDGVEFKGNAINYKGNSYKIEVVSGAAEDGKSIYFDVTLTSSIDSLDDYTALLKHVRTVINKITQSPPQILWDGLGLYYSRLAYPQIYRIENLMRKLITKFMIINAGLGWHKQVVPREVEQSIKGQSNNDYLHNVDFIQLSVFLFKEYEGTSSKIILDKIRKAKEITELELTEIKTLSPQSNWDRYFAPLINCDADFLKIRWQQLYELRNAVAHKRSITKFDLARIERLINELEMKITEAISKLSDIFVPNEEREEIVDNVASTGDELIGIYLRKYNLLHEDLLRLLINNKLIEANDSSRFFLRHLLDIASKSGIITPNVRNQIQGMNMIKNELVHKARPDTSAFDLRGMISRMANLMASFNNIEQDFDLNNVSEPDLPF